LVLLSVLVLAARFGAAFFFPVVGMGCVP